MHIQRLHADHAAAYRALMLGAYAAAPDAFTSTPEDRVDLPLSWWRQRLEHPQGLSQVFGAFAHPADDGGALDAFSAPSLVGAVAVEYSDRCKTRHKAHLAGMYVLATHRQHGVGDQLLRAALAAARAQPGVCVLQLTVTEGNAPALALYVRHGFAAFGTEPMAVATPQGYASKMHLWTHWQPAGAPATGTAQP